MRKLQKILMLCAVASLGIFIGCGGDDDGGGTATDPRDEQGAALAATWNVSSAEFEDTERPDWEGATVTFTYNADSDEGTYIVTGVPTDAEGANAANVWGAEGETIGWTFASQDNVNTIVREDGVEMNIGSLAASSLSLSFELTNAEARVAGFNGTWEFTLSK